MHTFSEIKIQSPMCFCYMRSKPFSCIMYLIWAENYPFVLFFWILNLNFCLYCINVIFISAALCGMVGYRQFFSSDWLRKMLSWQNKAIGCYHGNPIREWEVGRFFFSNYKTPVKILSLSLFYCVKL